MGFRLDSILTDTEKAPETRLRRDVDVLAGLIGVRHWWKYDALMAAEHYVRQQFEGTGRSAADQSFDIWNKPVRNLILEQRGERRPEQIVVVGAHYDSVEPTPGADDNASGVAGVLEIARQLAKRHFRRTIRYVAFVNEEPPFYKGPNMGSLRYARLCQERRDRIIGMVNLEMIGYFDESPGAQQYPPLGPLLKVLPREGNFVAFCSNLRSLNLLRKCVWGFRRTVRFPVVPFPTPGGRPGGDMSDNWSFWQCGYPAIMVTDTSFLRNRHYHRTTDTPETLHYPAITRVVQGLTGAVARLSGEL